MAHHASAAVGRRDLLVRLVEEEEEEAARLAVPLLLFVVAAKELGADPGRPPCRERRAADTMMVDSSTVVESDDTPCGRAGFGRFYAMMALPRTCCVRKQAHGQTDCCDCCDD